MAIASQLAVHSLLNADVGGFKPIVDYPGDNCCYLYDRYNFQGGDRHEGENLDDRRLHICHEGSRKSINVGDLGWNNKMSSYICGKSVWFDFCIDPNSYKCYNGDRTNNGAGHIRNNAVRHLDNRLSIATLGPYDPREIGAVTLFEQANCAGATGRYYWDPESTDSGTFYNQEDLYYGGMRNNRAESVLVPKGYIVELHEGNGFYGAKQIVEGKWLNADEEMECVNAPLQVSSLVVKRQPQGIANAYWQSVTTSESQDVTFNVGVTYKEENKDSFEESDRLNAALDLGLTYLSAYFPPLKLIPK